MIFLSVGTHALGGAHRGPFVPSSNGAAHLRLFQKQTRNENSDLAFLSLLPHHLVYLIHHVWVLDTGFQCIP